MNLRSNNTKDAFGLLEMLLAGSIFVLLLFSVISFLLFGRDALQKDNLSTRASLIASEGMTAIESIRAINFNNLVDGVYGLSFNNGAWSLFGNFDEVGDFTRFVTISTISDKEKKVSVEVNWFKSYSRLGRVNLVKHFIDWQIEDDDTSQDWWDENWQCRQELIIDNSSGQSVINDYQVLFSLNTLELINEDRLNIDCSDLRIVDNDQETILDYYIEENTCNTLNTRIWLKVPFIASFNEKSVFLYYKNPSAVSYSNIDNTFIRQINSSQPLILDLPLDEGSGAIANDYSANNNSASINNANWVNGFFDSALEFNGVNSYLAINNSPSLNPEEITIAAWLRWDIDPELGANWASIVNKNVDSQYRLHHNRLNTRFEFAIRTGNGNRWVESLSSPVQGVWYYLVGTYDGSQLKIYVNGQLENTNNHQAAILSSTSWLAIGRRTSGDRSFEGLIDKVQIYNRALNDDEILDLYNNYGQAILNYPGTALVRKYYQENLNFTFNDIECQESSSEYTYQLNIYDDWTTGYCANIIISTESESPIVWELELEVEGTVNSAWEANWFFEAPIFYATGLSYNETVVVGQPVTIGFCANRDDNTIPMQEANYELIIDSQWPSGYCATVNVSTLSSSLIEWFVNIEINGTISSIWDASWSFNVPILNASGLSYNQYISSDNPTSFGFCANLPPPMANYLIIDASNATAGGQQNRTVSNIFLSNNGSSNISIESITLIWSGNPPSQLREVFFESNSIWTGNISSGNSAVFNNNYIIAVGANPYNLSLRFQHSFSGRTINEITFNFSDGSQKSITNISL